MVTLAKFGGRKHIQVGHENSPHEPNSFLLVSLVNSLKQEEKLCWKIPNCADLDFARKISQKKRSTVNSVDMYEAQLT